MCGIAAGWLPVAILGTHAYCAVCAAGWPAGHFLGGWPLLHAAVEAVRVDVCSLHTA